MKLGKIVLLPSPEFVPAPVQKIFNELLLFDAQCLPTEVSRQLVRMVPMLALVRRAWRNLYRKNGCNGCPKPDPTMAICARMRIAGLEWEQIYCMIGGDYEHSTLEERKHFKALVKRKMRELAAPTQPLPKEQLAKYRSKHHFAAGGLCDKCRDRNRRRVLRELAKLQSSPEETRKAIAGLSRRYDVAQWLLNSEEAEPPPEKVSHFTVPLSQRVGQL
jgi:hypothetical protein